MQRKYSYLKKFMSTYYDKVVPWPANVFYEIDEKEVTEAEKRLGFCFPSQLKEFYQNIGEGRITSPEVVGPNYKFYEANRILPPHAVANFALGILEWPNQEHWMAKDTYEDLKDGDLPFFEIGDSSSFLLMKAKSDNPNAVWYMGADKIEDSFERFIWRLYHESPKYYLDLL